MCQPAVLEIIEDLHDYKRSALGNVDDLESQRVDLLRIAESELSKWESENEYQIMESCDS